MKTNARWTIALAVILGTLAVVLAASLRGVVKGVAVSSPEVSEATEMMGDYEAQERAAATARAKDPTWKPSCEQVGQIQIGDPQTPGALKNFCLDPQGNILACFAPNDSARTSDAKNAPGLRVYSPKGDLLKTLPLEIKPTAVCVGKDGAIFVAGEGRVLKLDTAGKLLVSAASPVANEPVSVSKEMEDMLKQSGRPLAQEKERMLATLKTRRADVTGLTATEQDLFMAVPAPNDFTFRVYRFDQALKNPKLVVEKLRGCCGQMDIQSYEGKLWIPHNARHQVESHDRDGNQLSKFGTTGKVKASDFGGCCEPKNLRVLPNGEVLAAESGPPTCVKRFSASGKFLGVVAVAKAKGDCVRVTIERSPDGSRYYLLDTARDAILIFGAKS